MPSDLDGVHKSDLVAADLDVQVSQMSFTEADSVTLNNLLEIPPGEGLCTLCVKSVHCFSSSLSDETIGSTGMF